MFPWRNTSDPYSIWLSEVMLQQTRVSTVLPYYRRWISTLPDIQSVSKTDIDNVLKLWEGLGYYNRARNFHKSCQIIFDKYGGEIPNNPSEFLKLPGVGPYICSAVMSIAFNFSMPAIDGNAVRVVSRLNSINTSYPLSNKRIQSYLSGLISPSCPGVFNQAIMDLGREICTPKNPSCDTCPVSVHCKAYVNNTVDKYPVTRKKISVPHYHLVAGIIRKNNKIIICKRKSSGFLAGLWEFPASRLKPGENVQDCVVRGIRETLDVFVDPIAFIKQIKHAYSHFSITMDAYFCHIKGGHIRAVDCADYRWIYPDETNRFAFHRANHKLFNEIKSSIKI